MNKYAFVLGQAFELARAELEHVLKISNIKYQNVFCQDPIWMGEFDQDLDCQQLISRLGGTVKITQVMIQVFDVTADNLRKLIDTSDNKIDFGISTYLSQNIRVLPLLKEIKNKLTQNVRYVLPKNGNQLSSIVILKQKLQEILIIFNSETQKYALSKTLAIQDAPSWSKQDFGRPCADAKSGMLPPKVARMMVNLAASDKNNKAVQPVTLLDPFCGMGTILQEAMLAGWQVIGADNLPEAIAKAEKNLHWLISNYQMRQLNKYQLIIYDATHIADKIKPDAIDAIVTEPFMGLPFEIKNQQIFHKNQLVTKNTIENMLKGLEKLYIGCLREWVKILKNDGKIVMIFPEVSFNHRIFSVKKVIDSCENLGYTVEQGPYIYSRPQAIVRRKIVVFQKK